MPRSLTILRRAAAEELVCPEPIDPEGRLREQGLLPDALDPDALQACEVTTVRVAVIGGGLAGLTAGWYLQAAGVQVTVFEASDHPGGRVLTDTDLIPGKVVEAGAELIGTNHLLWFALARTFGLLPEPITTAKQYQDQGLEVRTRLGDRTLTDEEVERIDAEWLPVFDGIGVDAFSIDPVRPWLSADAALFDAMSVSEGLDRHFGLVSSEARTLLEFVIANDNCAPVERQSYLGLLALVSAGRLDDSPEGMRGYWDCTETHRCSGGNQQLAHALAGQLGDLRLDTPVDRITVADDSVGVDYSGPFGGSEAFDHVILAAPPNSWPTVDGRVPFDPSAYSMDHGPAVKYLTGFDRAYWIDDSLAPSALWDLVGSVWENTDRQDHLSGGYGMSIYAGGPYVTDEWTCADRLAELYPHGSSLAARYVDWPNEPYVDTGYSVPAPGQVTTVGQALSEPFDERVSFAGEQTCLGFFGYMEGALQSGARAASRLVLRLCPNALPSLVA